MAGSAWAAPFRPRTQAYLQTIPMHLGFVKWKVSLHAVRRRTRTGVFPRALGVRTTGRRKPQGSKRRAAARAQPRVSKNDQGRGGCK